MADNLLAQPFFLLGLAAVGWMFLGGTLAGFALFMPKGPHIGLLRAQSLSLAVLLTTLAWGCWQLVPELQGVIDGAEFGRSDVLDRRREGLSMTMLGVSAVFNTLITGFAWVRNGYAGNAFRAVIWAVPSVKAVSAMMGLFALLERTAGDMGEPLKDEELPAAFLAYLEPAQSSMESTGVAILVLFAVSIPVSIVMTLRTRAADSAALPE